MKTIYTTFWSLVLAFCGYSVVDTILVVYTLPYIIIVIYDNQAIVSNLWGENQFGKMPVSYFINQLDVDKSDLLTLKPFILNAMNRPLRTKGLTETFYLSQECGFENKSVIVFGIKELRGKQVLALLSVVLVDTAEIKGATNVNNSISNLILMIPAVKLAELSEKNEIIKDYLAANSLFKMHKVENIILEENLDLLSGYLLTNGYLEVERYNVNMLMGNKIKTLGNIDGLYTNNIRAFDYINGMYTQFPFSEYKALKFFFRDSQYFKFGVPYGHRDMDFEMLPLKQVIIKLEKVHSLLARSVHQK